MDFKNIMEFNAPYNQRNFDALVRKIKLQQVVPYVGAGMSILFDGVYPSWREFLNATFEEFVDPSQKEMFDNLSYEDKADFLYDDIPKLSFADNLKETFGQDHLNRDIRDFRDKAISLLPVIFEKGLIITTNYDKVIEKIYGLYNFVLPVAHPGHFEALNIALRDNKLLLYKIHGDISEPIESIILTKAQYDSAYSNQQLSDALKQIYTTKSILFLGCSLEEDRPIRLLCEVSKSGMNNYAIVECSNEDKKKKRADLENEYYTQSILYPEGKHECVKIILEQISKLVKPNNVYNLSTVNKKELDKDPIQESFINKSKIEDINYMHKVKICKEIKRLLIENYRIFIDYGPKSEVALRNPLSNVSKVWRERKEEKVVPNNQKIVEIIERNRELFSIDEYDVCYEFIEHANGFKKSCNEIREDIKQFPKKFSEVIDKYAKV